MKMTRRIPALVLLPALLFVGGALGTSCSKQDDNMAAQYQAAYQAALASATANMTSTTVYSTNTQTATVTAVSTVTSTSAN